MTDHVRSELAAYRELFLSILITACLAVYCMKTFQSTPWLPLIGVPIGLILIVMCWEDKKHHWTLFLVGLVINSLVWLIFLIGYYL